jgi:hypothetical protein
VAFGDLDVVHAKIGSAAIQCEDAIAPIANIGDRDLDEIAIGLCRAEQNRFLRPSSGTPDAAKFEDSNRTAARHSDYNTLLSESWWSGVRTSDVWASMVSLGEAGWSPVRRREPLTIGVPLPRGLVFTAGALVVEGLHEQRKAVQVRALDQWPDGSIRWALVDCQIDADRGHPEDLVLRFDNSNDNSHSAAAPHDATTATSSAEGVRLSTGRATFGFFTSGAFPVSEAIVEGHPVIDVERSGLQIGHAGRVRQCRVTSVQLDEAGPLRSAVSVHGTVVADGGQPLPVDLFARVEAFAGSATVRVAVTIRNRQRAAHPGGRWTLGDAGSVLIESAVLALQLRGEVRRVQCATERGETLGDAALPFEIHQESSGGEHWNGPIHRNRDGRVPVRYRGYRRRDGAGERAGQRATPIVAVETEAGAVSVAVPQFWQNFPRAISVGGGRIDIGLFPGQDGDLCELRTWP